MNIPRENRSRPAKPLAEASAARVTRQADITSRADVQVATIILSEFYTAFLTVFRNNDIELDAVPRGSAISIRQN